MSERELRPDDFAGDELAWFVDCGDCGSDAHLISWKVNAEPETCPFCGSDAVQFYNEAEGL